VGIAQDTLFAMPAVFILAGLGLHWLFVWFERTYSPFKHERFIVTFALLAFLLAVGIADASSIFVIWAHEPKVANEFSVQAVDIAQRLNEMPPATLKYVVSNGATGVVQYLTDTENTDKQREHNIYYLTPQQFQKHQYPKGAVVMQLH
jgi:hypothetical protein